MKKIQDATQVFVIKLQALYDIEKQLEKALPKLAKASNDPELKKGFQDHLKETEEHSKRLEGILESLGMPIKKEKSQGIRGIIKDGGWVVKQKGHTNLKDTMIASSARYAEHYEMAGYMSAIEEATTLGLNDIAEILKQTLKEEQNADKKLEGAMKKSFKA